MNKLHLLVFLIYATSSFAQEKPSKKVRWGYKLGTASTGASSKSSEILNQKNIFGFCAGIFADIKLGDNENILLRPTIQLVRQGSNIEFKNSKQNSNIAVRELGISVPLGLLYRIDNEFEVGFGATSTLWIDSNFTDVQTTTGLNIVLGYVIDEKTDLQLNYSFETKSDFDYKRNALGLSVLRYL